ncbi:MAG TPA: hypothetical protein VFA64_02970 [Hyphomicrobiaceae bacterium]|nr:hypothetical protein [Hyphomicrobiaceae bacterium]
MSATWITKYGVRRVRVEPPTFEDALFAAEGLTADKVEQIEIAASLMQVPVEQAQAEAERIRKERASRPQTVRPRRSGGAVVVERRSPRRAVRELHR